MSIKMEDIVNFAKSNGFVYQGSEIYGGLANTWDYGPLGVEFKNNLKRAWWKKFIQEDRNNVGLDAAILMNPQVWEASGHVGGFSDPLMDCKECKTRHRADKLIEEFDNTLIADGWTNQQMEDFIKEHQIKCPNCGKSNFTEIRQFNLMFKTFMGVTEDAKNTVYLRPETAQGIFVNFKNVQRTSRLKLPFGIGQIGKSFRNEITPGNFIFRTREFEQMELEFFCKPEEGQKWYKHYQDYCMNFVTALGVKAENLRMREHGEEELSHYSAGTADIEYKFPFGWGEIWGIANRTNYDLMQHQNHSKQDLTYLDQDTNEKILAHCIEPSVGADRLALTILIDSYNKEIVEEGDEREVLKLHPFLAPYKVAVLPLMKKIHGDKADEVYALLSKFFMVTYDESQKIGKRYRRQDAIGTPFCLTVDDQTLTDDTVTLRDRDTMEQIRISIKDIKNFVEEKMQF